ncbi:MAG: hypothetical protein IPL58_10130 [Betaproteobacteria bacterium]|uniref:DUF5666 domain-containing protein n=1 Tax=Candidatus Proximibacter danicus TaxID=2954365 RepID=A0A9D7K4B4_9PROT|nr:hypothetical protein [Candidatus Proximibacter danicus]
MNKLPLILAATLLTAPMLVQAQNQPQAAVVVEKAPGAGAVTEAVQLQGKIKSINKKTRTAVVVGPNGNEIDFVLSEDVRNFDQIKVGDLVTLTFVQALALELRKTEKKEPGARVDSDNTVTAKPGAKRGMVT